MFENAPWHRIRRALVRSRVRVRTLLAGLHLGRSYIADLAREARASEARVRGALFGDGDEHYRDAFGLVTLGLFVMSEDAYGQLAELTPLGEHVARIWMRETVRAAVGERRQAFA